MNIVLTAVSEITGTVVFATNLQKWSCWDSVEKTQNLCYNITISFDKGAENMNSNPRCLFNSDFTSFLNKDVNSIFGILCDKFHGDAPTTSREAWKSEIEIMRDVVAKLNDENGRIIFEISR